MMKFNADVIHQAPRPHEQDRFCTVPIEGDSAVDVARTVAELAARRRFGDEGMGGFVSPTDDPLRFLAFIGEYQLADGKGTLTGVTIAIHLTDSD